MRDMPAELNGWVCTDPSDYQYQKKINDNCFHMIQALDYPDDKWFVMSDIIDLECYKKEDIENIVTGFYNSLEDLIERYGEQSNGIIAECIFESIGTGDYSSEWFVDTEGDAVNFVYSFLNKE